MLEGPAFNPDWNPDGQWLAFNSGGIFKIRADRTGLPQITDLSSVFFPAWSPDGKKIAYDATSIQPQNGIWLIDENGQNANYLGLGREADWGSNRDWLVYAGSPGPTDSESQIWIADTTESNKVQLTTNGSTVNRAPAWSSDGRWIAWHANDGLWLMRQDGSEQQLLEENGSMPSWSPNSGQIVFSKPTKIRKKWRCGSLTVMQAG